MEIQMRTLPLVLIAAGSVAAVEAHAAGELRVGTAAVTQNSVTGLLGKEQRTLKRGDGVFQNESITTGQNAGAQLLFRDETALTMGPESRVILDKLIYDPDKKTGEVTIRAVSGAFRFVTGSGPKAGYKIQTPVGTIGVRGTIFHVLIRALGPTTQVVLQVDEGGAYICGATKCVDLVQGSYVVVTGNQVGNSESKYKECGSGGGAHCYVQNGDDTLYIDFLGLGRFFNDLSPAAGPNIPPPPGPGNGPPAPPGNGPPQGGFSPITNPGIGTPPGLDPNALPPGLQDRCPGGACVKPGPLTAPGRNK
jgi:hypothetical protein